MASPTTEILFPVELLIDNQLQRGEVGTDLVDRRVLRSFSSQRSGDLEIIFEPFWMRAPNGTTHGSPYSYDTNVPLALYGKPWIRPGKLAREASVADLAPTLSYLLEIRPPSASEGRVLEEALK